MDWVLDIFWNCKMYNLIPRVSLSLPPRETLGTRLHNAVYTSRQCSGRLGNQEIL